jgi:hypothetical protein
MRGLFGPQVDHLPNLVAPDCRMEIKFGSKQARDLFLLTLKAFFTKKQLKSSVVLHKIEELSFNENEQLNLLLEIEALRADMGRLTESNIQKEQ